MVAMSRAKAISWVASIIVVPCSASARTTVSTSPDQLRVERGGDLVEEQQGRLRAQRAHQRDPLLLAAGHPVGVLVRLVREPEAVEQLAGPLLRLGLAVRRAPCAAPACSCRARSGAGTGCRPGRPCRSGRAPRVGRPAGRRSRGPRSGCTPSSISSSRLRQRSSVDLPEPDDPIRQTTSCGVDGEVDVVEHDLVAVGLAEVGHLQERVGHRAPCRSRSHRAVLEPVGQSGERDRQHDEERRHDHVRREVEVEVGVVARGEQRVEQPGAPTRAVSFCRRDEVVEQRGHDPAHRLAGPRRSASPGRGDRPSASALASCDGWIDSMPERNTSAT